MNLQPVIRAAVCAALVEVCMAGAGWVTTRPAAGQEIKRQPLRGAAALERLKQDGQYDSLQAAMNQARFSVSPTEQTPLGRAAWRAPNAAAGYDAYVTEEGVCIAINDETYVSLNLRGIGYGEGLLAVAPGEVSGDKQTINLTRHGGLREWYVNGPDGLEHGFTLSEPPGARQQGSPLRLALELSSGWRAVASDDGKLVTLRGPQDEVIEYGKLVVRDKLGRNIPARLAVTDEQVVIEAEDHDAAYPLTIDPIFTLPQRLTAADAAANDYLGYAVALSGDTALVGAPYDDAPGMEHGSAYVFVRNGSTWTQQARLTARDGASFDYFGWSVALKGNLALVGAIYGPGPANPDQGAAYVFERVGSMWIEKARLNANESTVGAQFGAAVALDGDTALVGAPTYAATPSSADTGAAYVFTRSGVTTWTQQARLLANDGDDGDYFGVSLALDGDTALIGAPNNAVQVGGQGAAYIFTRGGASWTQRQRLTATNGALDDHFGGAVALSGDTTLIGAYLRYANDQGAVYVFERRATGWTETNSITASDNRTGAHFGVSVALDGDKAVIGASLGLFQPGVDQRSAYVFLRARNGGVDNWFQVRRFGPELGSADDRFGYAVALDGDTALVGAYRGDAGANDQGAAYAFTLRDSRSVEQQKLTAADGVAEANFGYAVAIDGDTLAVVDAGGANANQRSIYVFTRNGSVWTLQQKLTINDDRGGSFFGQAVALSGDTLVVGWNGDDIGVNKNQGSAYVFTRNGSNWTLQQKLTANDGAASDHFGIAVALDGDTLVVGAFLDDIAGNADQGSAYVFTRNGSNWTQRQKLTAVGADGMPNDRFGASVAISDWIVAVGAWGTDDRRGSAYVFTFNGAVWTQQQKLIANDGAKGDYFGYAIALSGDTLAVGAYGDTVGANNFQGSVYVFTRSGAIWTQQTKLTANDGAEDDLFGAAVAIDGNTLLVGAYGDDVGAGGYQGSAYVFTRAEDWYQQQKLIPGDGAANDNFGFAVALSGDTLAIGANGDTIGENEIQGSAYVFVNPPCPALAIAPASLPNGAIGVAYNQQFTTGDSGDALHSATVSGGELPPGLTLNNNTGLLSGAPTSIGTYRFTIAITIYPSGCSASREYTLTITQCPTITVNPVGLPAALQGRDYNQTLTAAGGATPYSFAVAAGALPPGLSLSAGGVLSGAPTQPGSYPFTARVTDARGCAATRAYTLAVGCQSLVINPATLPAAQPGAPYSQNLTATGGVAPYRFTVTTGALPPGLSLSAGGVLSGAPAQAGRFEFLVTAQDAGVCAAAHGYTLVVSAPVTHVSAANYNGVTLTPDSIIAAFGADLATETRAAQSMPLPTELAGATVTIRDSQGNLSRAPLFFVSPNQINYLMPSGLANGAATVTITNGQGVAAESQIQISAVAPGLFSANASGGGPAAALALRVRANGQQVYEPVARYDAQTQTFVLEPIDLSDAAEQVYLILFGTGIRHRAALEDVTVEIGGTKSAVAYAGAAPEFVGVDQINALLPRSLAGRGEVDVSLFVGVKAANTVRVNIR